MLKRLRCKPFKSAKCKMYQSKLFARHNKNPLALIYTYMYASVCVCVSACVMDCICMCVLWLCCKSANTPCCQLADIKARESFFFIVMLPCRRGGAREARAVGERKRGRGKRCKAACMTACVAYNYKSRAPKGWQHLLLQNEKKSEKKNKMAARPFPPISS